MTATRTCLDRLATTAVEATALLRDAARVLEARAHDLGQDANRLWTPSAATPALVIVIDEFAELTETAAVAVDLADSIARRGRAVAVTLLVATQRPTQRTMGGNAIRSQMSVRVCLRVRERRDVDLILDNGMLRAGWAAHTLDAPGKFYVYAEGHSQPRRARAYLVTDDDVRTTVERYTNERPQLDKRSTEAMHAPEVIDAEIVEHANDTDPEHALDGTARRAQRRPVRARTHALHRNEAHMDLRPPTGTRQRRPRPAGKSRTLARRRSRLTVRVRADVRSRARVCAVTRADGQRTDVRADVPTTGIPTAERRRQRSPPATTDELPTPRHRVPASPQTDRRRSTDSSTRTHGKRPRQP